MNENTPPWTPSPRYPDERIRALHPEGERFRIMNAVVERLATGLRWGEGPVWFGDQRSLFFSDIPNNRILRWDEATGETTIFRQPSNNANGNTRDPQGRLVTCEHLTRRVTRTEYDGSITVIADRFEGKRFNSPNDVVVKSDGSVWFTDPSFGIGGYYEGEKAEQELPHAVYRADGRSGAVTKVADGIDGPNGLAFSPDESIFYIVESRGIPRRFLAYDVQGDTLANRRIAIQCAEGETPDGFRIDTEGNLWCGWGMGEGNDGVRVFAPDGRPLLAIDLPERIANVEFGGRFRNRLFMAGSRALYSVFVNAQGL
ncbi:SMP-30/gluconolactonase/LRE family protein [Acetobacteraceae bacterium H6797]|nr:SMP-30/gluconolactonase/LRE family protein [Acetobacteraceae bacterium H6797]